MRARHEPFVTSIVLLRAVPGVGVGGVVRVRAAVAEHVHAVPPQVRAHRGPDARAVDAAPTVRALRGIGQNPLVGVVPGRVLTGQVHVDARRCRGGARGRDHAQARQAEDQRSGGCRHAPALHRCSSRTDAECRRRFCLYHVRRLIRKNKHVTDIIVL